MTHPVRHPVGWHGHGADIPCIEGQTMGEALERPTQDLKHRLRGNLSSGRLSRRVSGRKLRAKVIRIRAP